MQGRFWHLAHPTAGFVSHNTVLSEGLCWSISRVNQMPGLENALSPYALRFIAGDAKEHAWERVRQENFENLPSRRGAIFVFDDREFAERMRMAWFSMKELRRYARD